MKRIAKIAVGITMAATLAAGAGVLAGCTPKAADKTGEAYGLVHGGGYVGYSQITTNGDSVKELTLTEVCLPTEVEAGSDVAEADKVNGGTEEKPVGLVYMACCFGEKVTVEKYQFKGNREKIREQSVVRALDLVRRTVLENKN